MITWSLHKINARFSSLEDKFNDKILALKACLIEEIYELKNEIKLLYDKSEKVKPDAGEKYKINLLNLKVGFLEIWIVWMRETANRI